MISALIFAFNEAENLPKLFECIKGVDEIVLVDHNSTDNTAEVARSLGAKVTTRSIPSDTVTLDDVSEFKRRFSYDASFKEGDVVHRFGEERQAGHKLTTYDWILNIDCDEFVTWDIEKVKQKMENADIVNCKFNHIHNADGSTVWYQASKLYNKQKVWWVGRLHEAIIGYNLRVAWTDDMVIDHWQKPKTYREQYIPWLEYSILKETDSRSLYYLGKEYYTYGYYDKAVNMLTIYLKEALYKPEKVKAYVMLADSLYRIGREDEAWIYAMQSLRLNPNNRETYLFLAQIASRKDQPIWMKHVEVAEDEHLV